MSIAGKLRVPPEYRMAVAAIAFGLALFCISVGLAFADEHWRQAETPQGAFAAGVSPQD